MGSSVIRVPNMETFVDQKHLRSFKVKKLWEKRSHKLWMKCVFVSSLQRTWILSRRHQKLKVLKLTHKCCCFFWLGAPYPSHELFMFQLMRRCLGATETLDYYWRRFFGRLKLHMCLHHGHHDFDTVRYCEFPIFSTYTSSTAQGGGGSFKIGKL